MFFISLVNGRFIRWIRFPLPRFFLHRRATLSSFIRPPFSDNVKYSRMERRKTPTQMMAIDCGYSHGGGLRTRDTLNLSRGALS